MNATSEDIARVTECLAYIAAGKPASAHWINGVYTEARELGLMKPLARPFDYVAAAYETAILKRQERSGVYDI